MDEVTSEFLVEANESLEILDQKLVELEQNSENIDVVRDIFRIMHTLKGTCGFLGFSRVEKVAHIGENVFSKIRDGQLAVSSNVISTLFECLDRLREIIALIQEHGKEPEGDDGTLLANLSACLNPSESSAESIVASADATADDTLKPNENIADTPQQNIIADTDTPNANIPTEVIAQNTPEDSTSKAKTVPTKPAANSSVTQEQKQQDPSIRVNVEVLDNLMTLVSELVLTRNQLVQLANEEQDSIFTSPLLRLSQITSELQEEVMKTRMQPIANAWNKVPRLVRELSKDLNKKIELVQKGEDTELDRQVLELIKDPLTHMIRNAADHGLETNEERKLTGKFEIGKIFLNAYHKGGSIVIEVGDDGRGLDVEKIKSKILEKGLATSEELAGLTDGQILQYIFKAGFSTASQITSISGRGVGMDVVKGNIEKLGGSIELSSTLGNGTKFFIKIPLTLTIISALIIESCGAHFAIPQISVVELVRVGGRSEYHIEYIHNAPVLRLRNKLLPLVQLGEILQLNQEDHTKEQYVLVSQISSGLFGIVIDKVFDTQEIVVKPLSKLLRQSTLFSGSTILGDGRIVMIIDPNGIANSIGDQGANVYSDAVSNQPQQETSLLLIFRVGQSLKTVPLALVTRIDEVAYDKIEKIKNSKVIQYRGQLLPLVNFDEVMDNSEMVPILIFNDRGKSMGLLINEVLDIVSAKININLRSSTPGSLGTSIINGQTMEVIDCEHYLKKAYVDWFEANSNMPTQEYRANILLIDDSQFFRNLITPVLTIAGYKVRPVASGREALELCKKITNFDIIISDIEMPEMDGFELVRKLRQQDKWKQVPIIALSAFGGEDHVEGCLAAGFTEHVAKSDQQGLLHILTDLTKKRLVA